MTALALGENDNTTSSSPMSAAGNNTTNTESSGLEFSSESIWDEKATTTAATPINETHTRIDFIGNGTMTVPDTGETINMSNTGYAIVTGRENVFAYGKEYVTSEDDGDATAITYYEILQYDPATFHGKGIIIGAFDSNATGTLEPFNGMVVAGIHDDDPSDPEGATIKLWEWEGGIGDTVAASIPGQSTMDNTTTTELPPSTNTPR